MPWDQVKKPEFVEEKIGQNSIFFIQSLYCITGAMITKQSMQVWKYEYQPE